MKKFDIIVATDLTRGIGKDGVMPWSIPEDMAYFRKITATAELGKQNMVIMGRRTWESIPENFRPLVGRINAVITSYPSVYFPDVVRTFPSLDAALEWGQDHAEVDRCFVMGGGQLYAEAIRHAWADRLYVTQIHQMFDCDTFFPDYTQSFKKIESEPMATSKTGLGYQILVFEKKA